MTEAEARSVVSEVEVSVDPATAFRVFTEELDLWWVRGPINFSGDAGRVYQLRIEPGVRGRIVTVYDSAEGDEHPQAVITGWEPGHRVVWQSSRDDVETEVRFEPLPSGGTLVRVEARIPAGGADRGGTSWTRVVPTWFPRWLDRRDQAPHEQRDIACLALAVSYERPATAARWLADVFGFQALGSLPDSDEPPTEGEHRDPWIEFHLGNSSLMVFRLSADGPRGGSVMAPWVYVDDLASHRAHAEAYGAKVLPGLGWPWLATYAAEDLEGNRWLFAQARPTQR